MHKRFFEFFSGFVVFALVLVMLVVAGGVALVFSSPSESARVFVPLPPSSFVPEEIARDFSLQFRQMAVATEPLRLPEAPFVGQNEKELYFKEVYGRNEPFTLVNFWARWCGPCIVELAGLEKLKEHYAGRIRVIAVAVETGVPVAEIAGFLADRGIDDFAAYNDKTGDIAAGLGLSGIPVSYILDRNGMILYQFQGDADWTSSASQSFFDSLLKKDEKQ